MSLMRRAAALALIAAASVACGAANTAPVTRPGPMPETPTGATAAEPNAGVASGSAETAASGVVVSGLMMTSDRRPLRSAAVILSPLGPDRSAPIATEDVEILPDGRFTFRNVPPGKYQIRGRGETDARGASLFATFTIVVERRDLRNLTLMLAAGGTVEGVLIADSAVTPRATLGGVRVRAPLLDGAGFGDSPTGDIGRDGSFQIRGVLAGEPYITVEGLPAPWVLKSVTYRGRDITDLPIDVGPGDQFHDVRVTAPLGVTDEGSLTLDLQLSLPPSPRSSTR